MIQVIFEELNHIFNYKNIQICKLRLYETPKCFVELINE